MEGVEYILGTKHEWLYFLDKRKSLLIAVGSCLLGLAIASKPITFGTQLGICIVFVLFFAYPELGLFSFATLIPLHIVIVKLLRLFPGMWKECLLGLTVVLWFANGFANRKLTNARTKINLPLSLFIFWGFLLLLVVDIDNYDANIAGLRNLLQYSLVFFLAVNLIKNKSRIKKYIISILILAVVIATTNNFLFVFRRDLFTAINIMVNPLFPTMEQAYFDRMITLTFMGSEYYAYYMSLVCCLLVGLLLFARSKLSKIVLAIGICPLVVSLLLSQTRGGIVSLLVAVLFFGICYNKKLVWGVTILSVIVAMCLPMSMYERLVTGLFGYNTSGRLSLIRGALVLAGGTPVCGMGLGNVGAVVATGDKLGTPHNYYCYLALQTGFVGLLIYLWILIAFFKTSIRVYEKMDAGYFKGLSAGLIMFFVAFSVSALFVGSGEAFILAPFYWLFGGFVVILDNDIKYNSHAALSADPER